MFVLAYAQALWMGTTIYCIYSNKRPVRLFKNTLEGGGVRGRLLERGVC